MPKLQVSPSRPRLPQPVYTGDSQGAAVARADAKLAGQFADLGDRLTQRQTQNEISQLTAEFAKAQAELTVEWEETLRTADPNDTEVASRFQQRVEDRLDKLGEMAKTREAEQFYSRASSGLSAGFLTTTSRGQAGLRETAAVQNWQTMLNQSADATRANPDDFAAHLATADILLDGQQAAYGLSTEKRLVLETQARRELALANAIGRIDKSPAEGRAAVEAGVYSEFLDADDTARMVNYATAQENAQRAARERAIDENAKAASSQYLSALVAPNGSIDKKNLPGILGQIANDPRYLGNPGEQRAVFNMLEAMADDGDGKTDAAVYDALKQRALLPTGDPNRLTREEVFYNTGPNGPLTFQAANSLIDRLDQKDTPEGRNRIELEDSAFRAARTVLTESSSDLIPIEDPNKLLAYQNWSIWARDYIQRDNGATPINDLYAANGPLLSALPRFQVKDTVNSRFSKYGSKELDTASIPTGFDNARQEGETAEEYLRRTRGGN